MTQIQTGNQIVTQITVIEAEPEKQNEALSLMTDRARYGAPAGLCLNQLASKPRRPAHHQLRPMAKPRAPAVGPPIAGLSQGVG